MVIDTAALVAIALLAAMRNAAIRVLCSVSLLEAGIVLRARMGAKSIPSLYELVEEIDCEIVPFDASQTKAAIAAFGRFGKGMGHRAQPQLRRLRRLRPCRAPRRTGAGDGRRFSSDGLDRRTA